ncbi:MULTISPECIES: M20 family metallopeptidase [unclassified Brevibacterium]|uniref:M20 metallopeptidase family protein n=1 Tax=unclassified Brevibacterium TaxID=2614124 RepID=UPI001E4B1D8C|nr:MULTISPECIES: M20 family metallopeptidase [unclassified Brevibacterium]MCD1285637.1 amidohydrolase [Brevibacterium sp. CCUG 69071]MDK8434695.1 M20 family metallopeptidase [Brevibacterium sp. H-BE7]
MSSLSTTGTTDATDTTDTDTAATDTAATAATATSPGIHLPTAEDAADIAPGLVTLRRTLHENVEVGLDLPTTQKLVLEAIEGLDIEVTKGNGLSSLTVVLRGGQRAEDSSGVVPAVLLRGDMDGLPVTEATGFDFAATSGRMHACGHDLHTAGLVGALKLLHRDRDSLPGDVVFMFQPGEEGYDGAGKMIAEGILDAAGPRVKAAYGLHVSADQDLGVATSRRGSYMAAFAKMTIIVRGKGTHASRPATGRDPIQVGAMLVGQLQEYVTRRFDIFDPLVITVGQFNGGTASNVIPDFAELVVSVRTFSETVTARAEAELPQLVTELVAAHGLDAEVDYEAILPPTINDAAEADFFLDTFAELFGPERAQVRPNPLPGSEDFSRVLDEVPGAYGHFGVALPNLPVEEREANHSPRARHSDEGLADHALFLAHLAGRKLAQLAEQ